MAIMLTQLCANAEKTYGMKLLAGNNGLYNTVRWVHMVEDREVPDFLLGNELIFTTGIGQKGTKWLQGFVKSLVRHNASGLVVNIGPYIKDISPQLIELCNQYDFPLFSLPWKVHIIDITYDFCHRIISNEETETSIATAFKNLIYYPKNTEDYSNVLEKAGFHNENSYQIISICMKINGKWATSKDWKSLQHKYLRKLRKSSYPVAMFYHEKNLIVVRQNITDNEKEFIKKALDEFINAMNSNTEFFIGISNVDMGHQSVPSCFEHSIMALKTAIIRKINIMHYNNIGVYSIILGTHDTKLLTTFVENQLGKLLEYDRKNNSDFTNVLKHYLQSDGSISTVAKEFNVHRNTINYKIKQIKSIMGVSLDYNDKLQILLALYIDDMLKHKSWR